MHDPTTAPIVIRESFTFSFLHTLHPLTSRPSVVDSSIDLKLHSLDLGRTVVHDRPVFARG